MGMEVDAAFFGPLDSIAMDFGYDGVADANNIGGRKVVVRILRVASGELPMPE